MKKLSLANVIPGLLLLSASLLAQRSPAPQNRGFDYFYGHLGGNLDYYTHVYGGRLDWQRNGVTVREPGYTTDLIVRETVQ